MRPIAADTCLRMATALAIALVSLPAEGAFRGLAPSASSHSRAGEPVTANDVVGTPMNTPVTIDVLANDSDPDGTPLKLIDAGTPLNGTAVLDGDRVVYTPNPEYGGVEHFLYSVSDDNSTVQGVITVYVGDQVLPPPSRLTVSPSFIDFGVVSVNKTRDVVVTLTNDTATPIALAEAFPVVQNEPFPFDTSSFDGCGFVRTLDPGQSCTRSIRFWAVADAGDASPAWFTILDGGTFEPLATVPMFASVGSPDTSDNLPPEAIDDLSALVPGITHFLHALMNDSDPDEDLLRITEVSAPSHGTATVVSCGEVYPLNPNVDCIKYVADPGYLGLDAVHYTVSDGRGGTASATFHLALGNVVPVVSSITPQRGPVAGGQPVLITGSNFLYGSSAAFVCAATTLPLEIARLTDTEIQAVTSFGVAGACDLRVTTRFAQAGTLTNAYQYEGPGADLGVSVTASPAAVNVGEAATFDVVLTNLGPNDAPSARLTVLLPPFDLNLVNFTAPGMTCSLAAGLVCDLTNFTAGTTRSVTVVATAGAAGPLTATFSISSTGSDPNQANNSASATVTAAAGADLTLVVSPPPTAVAGGPARFTVTVVNSGPSVAAGVTITMPVHAGFTLGGVVSPGGPCTFPVFGFPGTLSCVVNTPILIRGEYSMTVDIVPAATGNLTNTFHVGSTLHDHNPADNDVTTTIGVQAGSDVAVTAVPSRTVLIVGDTLTYAIAMSNRGPSNAPTARLDVALPAGLQFVGYSGAGVACTVTGSAGACTFANFTAGSTRSLSITARVLTPAPVSAAFTLSTAIPDPVPSNNTAQVAVDARPTVTIDQAADQGDPSTLSPVLFTVVFGEPVTGFTGADVSFAGSSVGGTLTAAVSGNGTTYTVAVSGMTGIGTVAVAIPAGAAVDAGGNPSTASTSSDRTVLFGVATVVALASPANGGTTALTLLNTAGRLTGIFFYSRGSVIVTATRFTSLVIDGQTAIIEGFSTSNRLFVIKTRDGGSSGDDFRLWLDGIEQTAPNGALSSGTVIVQPWAPDTRLKGWVDLHTHPMSNLAFGGKLFHGAPSAGSLLPAVQMPADPQCRFDQRATGIAEALSQDGPTRGDPVQSRCGDFARNLLIQTMELVNGAAVAPAASDGYPNFTYWPRWNDITHQKMWIDWIRRSWEGGQRVMVALSHNNRTLAEMLGGGAATTGVRNDRASSDLQIEEIKQLVAAHSDFMAVATTPDELRAIVQSERLAVVLGVEIDKIGDFSANQPPGEAAIDAEVERLYQQGVRYIVPVHFVDNAFGDAAVDEPLYNVVNFRENQQFFSIGCAQLADGIGFRFPGLPAILAPFLLPGMPPLTVPSCMSGANFLGHVNNRSANGLTARGEFAVRAMMRRGIIVDVDHMSNRAANRTLAIANAVPNGGYPITSGHSGVRERTSSQFNAEHMRSTTQLARIACLGGMFGLGTDTASAHRWAAQYEQAYTVMRRAFAPNGLCATSYPLGAGFVGLGTDANSLVRTPVPPMFDPVGPVRFADIYNPAHPLNAGVPQLNRSTTGTRTWDYNVDGVAHYGMFVDFLRDVRMWTQSPAMNGRQIVDDQMMYGADYFYRMWQKADTQKTRVP